MPSFPGSWARPHSLHSAPRKDKNSFLPQGRSTHSLGQERSPQPAHLPSLHRYMFFPSSGSQIQRPPSQTVGSDLSSALIHPSSVLTYSGIFAQCDSLYFLLYAFPSVEHKRYEHGGYTSLAHFITSHEITGTHGRGKTSLRLKGASAAGDSRRSTWGRAN